MAQIQSPETYVDGQQVTAARLNNQTNGAILLPGVITDQTALAAGTVATGDGLIVHDASASALRKTTAGDLLGSGVPITTSAITGSTGADLVITPAAGQKVDIAGNLEADDISVTDDLTVGDDATISGDLIVTGGSTLTGNVIADNGFTSNGVANFTGTLQVNGAVGYVTAQGTIDTVNTSSYTVGQVLYLSPYSAGQLMNTIPPTGITVQVGVVTYVDSSAGQIYVKQTTPLNVPASIISGTVAVANGGTGFASYAVGDVLYASGATTLTKLGIGTAGQVLTVNGGATAPSWVTPTAYATVTDDTTTNGTRYLMFADQTTGNLTTTYVSSTKLKYNPSTGALTASQLIIAP